MNDIRDSLAKVQELNLLPCPHCGDMPQYTSTSAWCAYCEGYKSHKLWNTRHGAGDADRSAELTTAWMAGAESVRDRAAEAWRSIESAPKKGRVVLYDADRIPSILIAHWRHGAWWGDMTNSGRSIVWRDATHWRPLPAPPTEDAARAGERGHTPDCRSHDDDSVCDCGIREPSKPPPSES